MNTFVLQPPWQILKWTLNDAFLLNRSIKLNSLILPSKQYIVKSKVIKKTQSNVKPNNYFGIGWITSTLTVGIKPINLCKQWNNYKGSCFDCVSTIDSTCFINFLVRLKNLKSLTKVTLKNKRTVKGRVIVLILISKVAHQSIWLLEVWKNL